MAKLGGVADSLRQIMRGVAGPMQQIDSAAHPGPEVAQMAQDPQTRLGITIVVPVYNEEESLRPLYEALSHQLYQLGVSYEIIFVDDGSSDGSFNVLQALHDMDSRVRVVRFRRNFGKTPRPRSPPSSTSWRKATTSSPAGNIPATTLSPRRCPPSSSTAWSAPPPA